MLQQDNAAGAPRPYFHLSQPPCICVIFPCFQFCVWMFCVVCAFYLPMPLRSLFHPTVLFVGVFFLSLLVFSLQNALRWLSDVKWIHAPKANVFHLQTFECRAAHNLFFHNGLCD